ncbi:hypothetical protein [Costertonia aggregata]|uniref:Periplasmic heavy metal sensor n=1 Tax=Costertonia aggregata TaxID=343403 RepID=A0A7H9AS23_9FLAO|nr:hypothetical protein [Costertonia aggregata]QLG46278.1 hypothetical protein HYG79_13295 [Costertonia aggregata]
MKTGLLCIALCFSIQCMIAQDCTLSIGGKDKDIIVQVFQLNEEQITQLETWQAELAIKNKLIEEQLQLLLDEHPQSTQEDLTNLAKKYKTKEQELVRISVGYDKKLLGIFNERQYQRYIELCEEALRKPLKVVRPSSPE